MKSLGTSLSDTLKSSLKLSIADYIQREFMTTQSIDEVLGHLEVLQDTIGKVPEGMESEYIVQVEQHEELDEGKMYFGLSLKKAEDDALYAISFVPFDELFRYAVTGYEENAKVVGDIIWDVTFDGWTQEQQAERIDDFQERIDSEDGEVELF